MEKANQTANLTECDIATIEHYITRKLGWVHVGTGGLAMIRAVFRGLKGTWRKNRTTRYRMYRHAFAQHGRNRNLYVDVMGHAPLPDPARIAEAILGDEDARAEILRDGPEVYSMDQCDAAAGVKLTVADAKAFCKELGFSFKSRPDLGCYQAREHGCKDPGNHFIEDSEIRYVLESVRESVKRGARCCGGSF